jgi:fructan beta-fructosidase
MWKLYIAALMVVAMAACGQPGGEQAAQLESTLAQCDIVITNNYLHFPVGIDTLRREVRILDDNAMFRYFDIEIPKNGETLQYWASVDVSQHKGKTLTMTIDPPADEKLLDVVEQGSKARVPGNIYQEKYRPQFHFSPQLGWTNDPNGLVYYDGEFHLFFQHNPYGVYWGNMTWGHAVSPDMVHWEEIGDALHPDITGTMYSGSAVVDHKNTSGLQKDGVPAMAAFYTSAGAHSYDERPFTQSMAYSTDKGRSWTKYEKPVVEYIAKGNRDPKVFWHDATQKWVMVLYLDRGNFVIFGSDNLKDWTKLSDLPFPKGHECPELFELAVDGNADNTRWVMWEGGGRHLIGRFDGATFTPETDVLASEWGPNCYAAQTYNDMPDGRRILIGWMRSGKAGHEKFFPGMPFNQQMTFPREFSLRTTGEGTRLFARPAKEIESLYRQRHNLENMTLGSGSNPLADITGELFDIEMELEPGSASIVTLNVLGTPITYDTAARKLTCLEKTVEIAPDAGDTLSLRVLVDRTSIEIFAADGRYVMSFCFMAGKNAAALSLQAGGGSARVATLEVRELKSIWQ